MRNYLAFVQKNQHFLDCLQIFFACNQTRHYFLQYLEINSSFSERQFSTSKSKTSSWLSTMTQSFDSIIKFSSRNSRVSFDRLHEILQFQLSFFISFICLFRAWLLRIRLDHWKSSKKATQNERRTIASNLDRNSHSWHSRFSSSSFIQWHRTCIRIAHRVRISMWCMHWKQSISQ